MAAADRVGAGSKCLAVVEAQALVTTEVLCAFEMVTVLILKHGGWRSINPFRVRIIKLVSLVRWFFCVNFIFFMRISVIFNFSNKSQICYSSLEPAGGLVLYVTNFKTFLCS